MNKTCQCGGRIYNHINFNELAECINCKRFYILNNEEWKEISKAEFRTLYRKKLIEQQKSI